jgi:hypothetical protein
LSLLDWHPVIGPIKEGLEQEAANDPEQTGGPFATMVGADGACCCPECETPLAGASLNPGWDGMSTKCDTCGGSFVPQGQGEDGV